MIYERVDSFQVLQRDASDQAQIRLNNQTLTFSTGGPYTIGDAEHVYVGDIWILAGQSNIRGWGNLRDYPDPNPCKPEEPNPRIHSFQSCESWALAEEPLHNLAESPRSIHKMIPDPTNGGPGTPTAPADYTGTWIANKGASPGIPFASMYDSALHVPVGLIPCAHGGTTMAQWSPHYAELGQPSLYNAVIERVQSIGGAVAGMLWYQGESDAMILEAAYQYKDNMTNFIQAIRRDLGHSELPIIYCQIGRCVSDETPVGWNVVRESQRQIAESNMKNVAMVSAIDTALDDWIHVSRSGLSTIGRRMAKLAIALKLGEGRNNCITVSNLTLEHVQFEQNPKAAGSVRGYIVLDFQNLYSWGVSQPIYGFSIRDSEGKDLHLIHNVTSEHPDPSLAPKIRLHLTPIHTIYEDRELFLWYGYGRNPICNLVDKDDMALPCFGPKPFVMSFGPNLMCLGLQLTLT
ncbi:hypothetical protein NQZ79_g3945 [Umbelopsis isabellina]|nr:hypothetical protein NQZ79_g3945 [Umbelopsis isabellina]